MRTLSIDCGGTGIKAQVWESQRGGAGPRPSLTPASTELRMPTPYPLPPHVFVETLVDLQARLPRADRATVGMPGVIRHGVVVHTPHYITTTGPHSPVDPDLRTAWAGLDVKAATERALGLPAQVCNDAEMHAAQLATGKGLELVLTLGTGLGAALLDDGVVAPHLEFSHAPIRRGRTIDQYIGEAARLRIGRSPWSRRVEEMVDLLWPVICWDRLYLGGGNAARLTEAVRERIGPNVVLVPGNAALPGGARLWDLPA